MPNGNNRIKPAAVVISVMATLIGLGIASVFVISMATAGDQSDHEASAASHPVIQNKVDSVASDVEVIDGKVDDLMLMQREQTVILERIGQDIGELKAETHP
jgi:peptidoglycan hydrolase CwlO-like protein